MGDLDDQNCMKLNNARTPYFDAGLGQMGGPGTYHYISTRNSNFSNRGQKGQIVVKGSSSGGVFGSDAATYSVAVGAAAGGAYVFAKKNPGSKLAQMMSGTPLLR